MNIVKNKSLTFTCMGCKLELETKLIEAIKVDDGIMIPYCKNCSSEAFIEDIRQIRIANSNR